MSHRGVKWGHYLACKCDRMKYPHYRLPALFWNEWNRLLLIWCSTAWRHILWYTIPFIYGDSILASFDWVAVITPRTVSTLDRSPSVPISTGNPQVWLNSRLTYGASSLHTRSARWTVNGTTLRRFEWSRIALSLIWVPIARCTDICECVAHWPRSWARIRGHRPNSSWVSRN